MRSYKSSFVVVSRTLSTYTHIDIQTHIHTYRLYAYICIQRYSESKVYNQNDITQLTPKSLPSTMDAFSLLCRVLDLCIPTHFEIHTYPDIDSIYVCIDIEGTYIFIFLSRYL